MDDCQRSRGVSDGYITEWYPKAKHVATLMGSGSVFDYPDPPKQDPTPASRVTVNPIRSNGHR